MDIWDILDINSDCGIEEILKGYSEKLKFTHPNEDILGFEKLFEVFLKITNDFEYNKKPSKKEKRKRNLKIEMEYKKYYYGDRLREEEKNNIYLKIREYLKNFENRISLDKFREFLENILKETKLDYIEIVKIYIGNFFLKNYKIVPYYIIEEVKKVTGINEENIYDFLLEDVKEEEIDFGIINPLKLSFKGLEEIKDVDILNKYLEDRYNIFLKFDKNNEKVIEKEVEKIKKIFIDDEILALDLFIKFKDEKIENHKKRNIFREFLEFNKEKIINIESYNLIYMIILIHNFTNKRCKIQNYNFLEETIFLDKGIKPHIFNYYFYNELYEKAYDFYIKNERELKDNEIVRMNIPIVIEDRIKALRNREPLNKGVLVRIKREIKILESYLLNIKKSYFYKIYVENNKRYLSFLFLIITIIPSSIFIIKDVKNINEVKGVIFNKEDFINVSKSNEKGIIKLDNIENLGEVKVEINKEIKNFKLIEARVNDFKVKAIIDDKKEIEGAKYLKGVPVQNKYFEENGLENLMFSTELIDENSAGNFIYSPLEFTFLSLLKIGLFTAIYIVGSVILSFLWTKKRFLLEGMI